MPQTWLRRVRWAGVGLHKRLNVMAGLNRAGFSAEYDLYWSLYFTGDFYGDYEISSDYERIGKII